MTAIRDFSGLVSIRKVVHGVEVRPLSFADLSLLWQTKGQAMMTAYDEIVKNGNSPTNGDMINFVNDILKFAPDLAKSAFLMAIDDDGSQVAVGDELMTAGEVWDKKMGGGKQVDVFMAIMMITVEESDTLKKIFKTAKTENLTTAQKVMEQIQQK